MVKKVSLRMFLKLLTIAAEVTVTGRSFQMRRHYVFGLSLCSFVCAVRYFYHSISWTVSMKLTTNIATTDDLIRFCHRSRSQPAVEVAKASTLMLGCQSPTLVSIISDTVSQYLSNCEVLRMPCDYY